MRELLRLDDHEVEVVHDGASALSKLDEFRADVVLLDIGLPRMDGFMVAHAIRARFANLSQRPRLVALTGHGREEDRHAALRSGFDGHLTKPVEPAHLLRMIAGGHATAPPRASWVSAPYDLPTYHRLDASCSILGSWSTML